MSCLFWGGTLLFFVFNVDCFTNPRFWCGHHFIFFSKTTLLAVENTVILLLHCYSIVFTGVALLLDTTWFLFVFEMIVHSMILIFIVAWFSFSLMVFWHVRPLNDSIERMFAVQIGVDVSSISWMCVINLWKELENSSWLCAALLVNCSSWAVKLWNSKRSSDLFLMIPPSIKMYEKYNVDDTSMLIEYWMKSSFIGSVLFSILHGWLQELLIYANYILPHYSIWLVWHKNTDKSLTANLCLVMSISHLNPR